MLMPGPPECLPIILAIVALGLAGCGSSQNSGAWNAQDITCDQSLTGGGGSSGSSADVEVVVSAPSLESGYPTVTITTKKAMQYVVRVAAPHGCEDCWGFHELKLSTEDGKLKAQSGPERCPVWPDFDGGNAPNNTIKGCERDGIQWYQDDATQEPATRKLMVTGIAGVLNSKFVVTVAYSISSDAGRSAAQIVQTSGFDYITQPQPSGGVAKRMVSYEGYVIDLLCVLRTQNELGWIAPDLSMALTRPETHHVWCLKMDVCRASGYGLVEKRTDSPSYELKYKLDKHGNDMLAAILQKSSGTNVKVNATGVEAPGQILIVSELSVTTAPSGLPQFI